MHDVEREMIVQHRDNALLVGLARLGEESASSYEWRG